MTQRSFWFLLEAQKGRTNGGVRLWLGVPPAWPQYYGKPSQEFWVVQ